MKVLSVCSSKLVAVEASASLRQAAAHMARERLGALAVLDNGKLVGVISEADLVCAIVESVDFELTAVHAYMTEDPVTVAPGDDIDLAARRMVAHSIGHLPVVESGSIVGMISKGDLLAVAAVVIGR